MSDTDASDTEDSENKGEYIKRDGLYLFLTDNHIRDVLESLSKGHDPNMIQIDSELVDLFVEMGVFFRDDNQVLELNQHHELTTIIEAPHIERLIHNDASVAALTVHLTKLYLPCVPMDSLKFFTAYEEDELEEGLDLLRKFRLVRPSMVIEGKHSKESVLEDADELIARVDSLIDLFENDERETIPIDELEAAIGELDSGERNEDIVMAVKESEFRDRVHQASSEGIVDVKTTDNLSTIEAGTTGTRLNESSDLAKAFRRFQTNLLNVSNELQEYTLQEG